MLYLNLIRLDISNCNIKNYDYINIYRILYEYQFKGGNAIVSVLNINKWIDIKRYFIKKIIEIQSTKNTKQLSYYIKLWYNDLYNYYNKKILIIDKKHYHQTIISLRHSFSFRFSCYDSMYKKKFKYERLNIKYELSRNIQISAKIIVNKYDGDNDFYTLLFFI